jgi:hypothetical protein
MKSLNIFVCYTIRDGIVTKAALETFSRLLSPFGSVFVDLIHNTGPDDVVAEWSRRLQIADVVVVVWTPLILTSPWVQREIAYASAAGVPLLVVDIRKPVLHFPRMFYIYPKWNPSLTSECVMSTL